MTVLFMSPLLAALEAFTPGQIWTLATRESLDAAAGLYQKGSVMDISWGGEEEIEFSHGEHGATRTLLRLKDGRLAWACNRCARQPCVHSLASLMLVCYLLRGSSAFGVPQGLKSSGLRKQLLQEVDDGPEVFRASQTPASNTGWVLRDGFDDKSLLDISVSKLTPVAPSKPQSLAERSKGRVTLTPGGVGFTRQIFVYHRSLAYAHPPLAVASFAYSNVDAATAEALFWAWFRTPDAQRELVLVHWGDEVLPVVQDESTGWTVRLELDLTEDRLTVKPVLLAHGKVFSEPFAPLGETLVFLPEVRRIAKLEPEASWNYWERLCGKLDRFSLSASAGTKRALHEPITVRVRNVTPNSFEARIDEWEYLDGRHGQENVSFLVVEAGSYTLSDGTKIKAGRLDANHRWTNLPFGGTGNFTAAPVVLTQVMTINENVGVTTRHRNIGTQGLELRIQEEEAADRVHAVETVGWVAIELGQASINGLDLEVGLTGNVVTHLNHTVNFATNFSARPGFFAQMQSYFGG
ncbi:MAG: hypothetical protein EBZ48_12480, partial [Proteobacteria bacterium]|nr:hypothetical protein [Pseudomonadota bacterium]